MRSAMTGIPSASHASKTGSSLPSLRRTELPGLSIQIPLTLLLLVMTVMRNTSERAHHLSPAIWGLTCAVKYLRSIESEKERREREREIGTLTRYNNDAIAAAADDDDDGGGAINTQFHGLHVKRLQ